MKTFRAVTRPGGEVSVSIFRPRINDQVQPVSSESQSETHFFWENNQELITGDRAENLEPPALTNCQNSPTPLTLTEVELDSADVPSIPRSKPEGLNLNGRRHLKWAGAALDELSVDPGECLFMTGTLPGGSSQAMMGIAIAAAPVVQRVQRWISNHIPEKLSFHVWEHQKRGALHLHLCVHCPDPDRREFFLNEWKGYWKTCIDFACEVSGLNLWERRGGKVWDEERRGEVIQADCQTCRSSVAGYFSKYLSKGGTKVYPERFRPVRYWGVSRPLTKLVSDLTYSMDFDIDDSYESKVIDEDCLSLLQRESECCYKWVSEEFDSVKITSFTTKEERLDLWSKLCEQITQFRARPGRFISFSQEFSFCVQTLYSQIVPVLRRFSKNTIALDYLTTSLGSMTSLLGKSDLSVTHLASCGWQIVRLLEWLRVRLVPFGKGPLLSLIANFYERTCSTLRMIES